jgi:hypothetical protein
MKKRLRKKLAKREALRSPGFVRPLTPQRITLDHTFASMLSKGEIGIFDDVRFIDHSEDETKKHE